MTPDKFTIKESFLDVGHGHQLYVHDWGKTDAQTPILFVHGGPGNGCADRDKRKFDPETQRVIFFDQRGSGKSLPFGSLEHNTTPDLVADIEKLADHLHLKKFVLVGGSWGSTLALAYGITHPERVTAMILDGIFTGTSAEIDWLGSGGWRQFFPDVWQKFIETVPAQHREHPGNYHLKHALGNDAEAAKRSAYAYAAMELALLKLDDQYQPGEYDTYDPAPMRIEMHYMANGCFMTDDYLVKHAAKLTMPVWLVQGRYDMVCPPITASRLHEALPDSQLIWTINGHMRQHEAANIQRLLHQQATGAI